jgi:hypothetical protein
VANGLDETADEPQMANIIVEVKKPTAPFRPAVPWAAHIRVQGSTFQIVKSAYGGSLAIQGLTANVSDVICYQSKVTASGGCIYFEAEKKQEEYVKQRLNLWNCQFEECSAAIGGGIRTIESGPSNVNKSQVVFSKNKAVYYGPNVGTYPSKIALVLNTSKQQKTLIIDKNTDWVAYPLVIKSGQAMENQ